MTKTDSSNSQRQVLSIDEAISKAGNNQYYQKRLVFVLCLQRIFIGFQMFCIPFLFKKPKFQCRDTSESSWESCMPTPENCAKIIEPVLESTRTLITEFNIYCDRSYL